VRVLCFSSHKSLVIEQESVPCGTLKVGGCELVSRIDTLSQERKSHKVTNALSHVEAHGWYHVVTVPSCCDDVHQRRFSRPLQSNERQFHFALKEERAYPLQHGVPQAAEHAHGEDVPKGVHDKSYNTTKDTRTYQKANAHQNTPKDNRKSRQNDKSKTQRLLLRQ